MTTKAQILKDIRRKCIDCCVYQVGEVRKCHLTECALHPYRFATDPNPSKPRGIAKHASAVTVLSKEGTIK